MRALHWLRALVVMGTLAAGLLMVNLPDELPLKFELLYPNHKQFGVLAWLLAVAQLLLRWRASRQGRLPAAAAGLQPWEHRLSQATHRLLMLLVLAVPLLGYAMSSSFTQSDGVPFFFLGHLPELLPKNDGAFEVYQVLHRITGWLLGVLVLLHVAGAVKHRLAHRGGPADVLRRMV